MLKTISNSVNTYIFNTVNNRVVLPNTTQQEAKQIKSIIPTQYWDTVSYDPNVKYKLEDFSNHDLKIPEFVPEFTFTNIIYKNKVVRSYITELQSEFGNYFGYKDHKEKAIDFKEKLEYYGIKLF